MINTLNRVDFTGKDGSTITIRPANINDAEQIIQAVIGIIESGTFIQKEEPRTFQQEIEFIKCMSEEDNMYVVVERENEILGIARVIRGKLEMKRHVGLFRTWLIERAQGMGIGKEIMKYTLQWCKDHRLHKLCLTVFASNDVAFKLYSKNGFIEEGRQKDQVILNDQYDDEILMAMFFD